MWYPQRQVTALSALRGKPRVLLRRAGHARPSWGQKSGEESSSPHTQAPASGPGWVSRTVGCLGHSTPPQQTNETWRLHEKKKRPPFLVNNPWQGYFPMRTPAYISGKSNTKTKCSVTMNIHLLLPIFYSKCSENTTTSEHSQDQQIPQMGCNCLKVHYWREGIPVSTGPHHSPNKAQSW